MTDPEPRQFWLRRDGGPWLQVTKEEYIAAEREAGFIPNGPWEIATAAFSNSRARLAGSTIKASTVHPDFLIDAIQLQATLDDGA